MKKLSFSLIITLLLPSVFVQAADINSAVKSSRPNVLFITIDDLNNDLGTYGHELVKSPHIDALATKGIRFDKAYSQAPMCTPSRASFMTGLYPDQTGIIAHGSHTRMTAHFRDHIPKVITMPQLFKNHGYFSGRVGKIYHQGVPHQIGTAGADDTASWHETVNPIGIDKQVEGQIHAFNEKALKRQSFGGVLSFLAVGDDDNAHTDGKVATAAIDMIKKNHPDKTGKPFFIGAGFYRPHTPFVAPKKYFDLYPLKNIKPYIAPKNDRNDIPAIALTDYKLLSGALEFSTKCKKKGIQPIIGLDVDFISKLNHKSRITFLCKNDIGFKNLNILSTKINTENEFHLSLDNIKNFSSLFLTKYITFKPNNIIIIKIS